MRQGLDRELRRQPAAEAAIVDAVRIKPQIDALRQAYGRKVVHIHLRAPLPELERRYKRKPKRRYQELPTYGEVQRDPTEQAVNSLESDADVVIDTKRNTEQDVFVRAACHLGFYGRERRRLVDVVVGGQYGSEGKGQIVAYLAPEYDYLVRVGGPNAGHSVWEDPVPYKFHQLPSGTRSSNAKLVIGAGAVISIPRILKEIAECDVGVDRLSIDGQAMIITDADIRNEKRRLVRDISSTGQGVGYATARRITGRGQSSTVLARDIPALQPYVRDTREVLESALCSGARVLLEGTQGTALSLYHGNYPYVTSRDTTAAACLAESGIAPTHLRKLVMVCRTYPIRVQNPPEKGKTSGAMSQEISLQEIHRRSKVPLGDFQRTERTTTTNRERRIGEFDWVLLRRAAMLNAPTDIALTFVDYLTAANRNARRFEQLADDTIRFIQEVERVAGAPVSLISTRFHSRSIIDRRSW